MVPGSLDVPTADKVIMFHDGFAIDKWEEFFKGHHFENVVLDTHQYLMMAEIRNHDLSVAAYQKTMTDFGKKIAQVNQYVPVVTGEWSLFNSYTAVLTLMVVLTRLSKNLMTPCGWTKRSYKRFIRSFGRPRLMPGTRGSATFTGPIS